MPIRVTDQSVCRPPPPWCCASPIFRRGCRRSSSVSAMHALSQTPSHLDSPIPIAPPPFRSAGFFKTWSASPFRFPLPVRSGSFSFSFLRLDPTPPLFLPYPVNSIGPVCGFVFVCFSCFNCRLLGVPWFHGGCWFWAPRFASAAVSIWARSGQWHGPFGWSGLWRVHLVHLLGWLVLQAASAVVLLWCICLDFALSFLLFLVCWGG